MGTRADFYIGRGENAEWLGSIGWDGYPSALPNKLFKAKTEKQFRLRVQKELTNRDDSTFPKNGWPWPWKDSNTTDYAYAFFDDRIWASCFGSSWFDPSIVQKDSDDNDTNKLEFPNMKDKQNIRLDKGSGLIIITRK
jgi:hypothetical protein